MEEQKYEIVAEAPRQSNAMIEIEKSRAVQEVQAALVIAKKFPRDLTAVYTKIMESCKRPSLANQAIYSYPRGGAVVSGASIRLAEVLAQNYGNIDFGVRELERRGSVSMAESYCWDIESNTRQTKVFEVPHEVQLKTGNMKKLSDPRDIYELVANNGARRMRACILGIIPSDFVEAALKQCRETMKKGNGEPLADRIRKIVVLFGELGVTQEMLEKKLGHAVDLTIADEIVDLSAIYNSLKDKQAKRSDFFDFGSDEVKQGGVAAELKEKLKSA